MTHEPNKELAKLIRRYANDPVAFRHLQRLPVFSVPCGSADRFHGLLEKLAKVEEAQTAQSA